ncbi:MAG: amidohydrolase family protein [Gammaproteobacteria bacterium]|nr:amidohydrolase family protein [Gammaproteobacteria bacterium]
MTGLSGCQDSRHGASADLILTNGVVYLGRDAQPVDTVAIAEDRIVYVGDLTGAKRFRTSSTHEIDLERRLLIPGLHDVHIHPLGIVSPGGCDLDSAVLSLDQMVPRLAACLANGDAADSGWLIVGQWNFTSGNQPSDAFPTMRAALDAVSREVPIILLGNDGHHGAANSATLSRASNDAGQTVGLTRETLGGEFAAHRQYIGVDMAGEPNGYVSETARELFGAPGSLLFEIPPLSAMPAIARKLAGYGITSIRDAAALVDTLPLYDALYDSGRQTFRLTLALFPSFRRYENAAGQPNIGQMVADMSAIRDKYADHPLIRADTVKLFVDGVIEGDPQSVPPTLPNAAQLEPYQQPLFSLQGDKLSINGYVDLDDPVCADIRDNPRPAQEVERFLAEHGFHPAQCTISRGVLEHPVEVIAAYVEAFDAAGFTVHAHAIGDRAVRTAIDAFEKIAKDDAGRVLRPHGIGHAQLVHPHDIPRAGRLGLNIAFTYAWIIPDRAYDLTVIPFVDQVIEVDLYNEANYTIQQSYPTASLLAAGALLTAGSDAPVDTREPRPFENIEQAVTRANDAGEVFNATEAIDIHSALAAYTINGAVALSMADENGSIEVGKKADLALLDRNVVELADSGRANEIGDTRVLMTIFDGGIVYTAPGSEYGR